MSRGDAVYGLSTRVGHGKDTRVPGEALKQLQQFLVSSHAGSFGTVDRTVVRAAMAVRVCGMARGGSGASHLRQPSHGGETWPAPAARR